MDVPEGKGNLGKRIRLFAALWMFLIRLCNFWNKIAAFPGRKCNFLEFFVSFLNKNRIGGDIKTISL